MKSSPSVRLQAFELRELERLLVEAPEGVAAEQLTKLGLSA